MTEENLFVNLTENFPWRYDMDFACTSGFQLDESCTWCCGIYSSSVGVNPSSGVIYHTITFLAGYLQVGFYLAPSPLSINLHFTSPHNFIEKMLMHLEIPSETRRQVQNVETVYWWLYFCAFRIYFKCRFKDSHLLQVVPVYLSVSLRCRCFCCKYKISCTDVFFQDGENCSLYGIFWLFWDYVPAWIIKMLYPLRWI